MSKHKQKEGCDNFVSTTPAAINQSSCRKDEERFILSGKRRLEPAMTSLMELLTSFAHALVKSGSECSICIIIPDFCQKLCTVDPLGLVIVYVYVRCAVRVWYLLIPPPFTSMNKVVSNCNQ